MAEDKESPDENVITILFFSGDHKQKFYWGHKEILIPGKCFCLLLSASEYIQS